jgi:hypothetical protein
MPWFLGTTRAPEAFKGDNHERAIHSHFSPPASDFDYSATRAWHRCTDLQTAVELLYPGRAAEVRDGILAFEKKLEDALADYERAKAGRSRTDFTADIASDTLSFLGGLYAELGVTTLKFADLEEPYTLRLSDMGTPVALRLDKKTAIKDIIPEKTLFGPPYLDTSKWSRAMEITERDSCLDITFALSPEWADDLVPCLNDMWFLTENEAGERMIGKVLVSICAEHLR